MQCQEARELITGLVDHELTAEERRTIESHLADCRRCQAAYRSELALKQQLQAAGAALKAPSELRERLLAQIGERNQEPVVGTSPGWGRWPSFFPSRLAIAGAALLLLAFFFGRVWQPADTVASSILRTHEKILAGEMTYLRARDAAELREQMIRAVDGKFAPMGYDFAAMNLFPAEGAVQIVGERKFLIVVYRGTGPEITCFTFLGSEADAPPGADVVFDAAKKMNFYAFSRGGVSAVMHREGQILCVLVSRMPVEKLLALARTKATPA